MSIAHREKTNFCNRVTTARNLTANNFARLAIGSIVTSAALMFGCVGKAQALLIGYYDFEGNANDASGNGNNGTLSAVPPTLTAPGSGYTGWGNPNSQAYRFGTGGGPGDPNNSFITVPIDINPSVMPQVTFGAWVKYAPTDATLIRGIISHDTGSFDRTLDIDTRYDGVPRWTVFSGVNSNAGYVYNPATTDWTFLAARYDATAGKVQMTINSVNHGALAATPGSGETKLTIGRNPNFDFPFVGLIDNVFVYNEYLSDAQVSNLYQNGPTAVPVPPQFLATALGAGIGALKLRRRKTVA